MATVEDAVRLLLGSSFSQNLSGLAMSWIEHRYRELVSNSRFTHLRKLGYISVPAPVTSGTCVVTKGSTTVTGDATAQAAWTTWRATGDYTGWFFRAKNAWYEIDTVTATPTLTLKAAYVEDDNTAAVYTCIKRFHPLASDCRWVRNFRNTRQNLFLARVMMEELDIQDPMRVVANGVSFNVALWGVDSNGYQLVELYPYAGQVEEIEYEYLAIPAAFTFTTTIPADIEINQLIEGARIDLMRYKMFEELEKGNVEASALCRNEYRAQETKWEGIKKAIMFAAAPMNDQRIIIGRPGRRYGYDYDIKRARDERYFYWTSLS